ncbi:MAG: orotidine-5'-phosphate decarboxylase [Flavobacteriales bacterium]|nr:orotidine-5'-phosphate decarboxylase [Flavobacteriales bacterium]
MNKQQLIATIRQRKSFLCVGLDSDIQKIPSFLLQTEDPVFEFNRRIIDATRDYCVAYKLNTAFYESLGADGWRIMDKTFHYIGKSHFTIADAKRGDIGNTCDMYARAFFEQMQCNAITLSPYMGRDSVESFLKYPEKFSIVLGLTSNPSAKDFQYLLLQDDKMLYKHIIQTAATWGTSDNMMFVVGATRAEWLREIRAITPNHFLLVPGVGAQGGSLEEVVKYGMNEEVGLLVNSSRAIIYASSDNDFDTRAAEEAAKLQQEMMQWI